ncbi:hypothetical protein M2459_001793 [Parabacteroides sp. PF5-5]|uniref:PH domain-containing protein n=1 Tax=unclassified Parabacteroides TaxID=2649774 RepID=UPI00247579E3|nr:MULTISPECIES: PH domain-containing protein [unclassified Parabacteroides]MDH6305056.1 hypothetical protein [Parabacteroides sp. PH5-39]MDH6315859.1 hypothetical protein [Parabacteroides sp. PF5-13]MDH6319516.1 hypothetical protein [Parabacteroides sp. PH5-13]MDH6323247.1 hypothetical protein [Parabacteroides sp. PH5-8]MDH6327245.1 hypothetical protein [Parabacteroides sp. PH5-41]
MDRVFKSKVDWWYHLLILIMVFIWVLAAINGNVFLIVGLLLAIALAVHTLLNTDYTITEGGRLIVHCGIFPKKEIAVEDIQALEPSILPMPSYSLSLNRIIIWSEGKMWMFVSPRNQQGFVKLLHEHKPEIRIIKDVNTDSL